MRTTALDLPGPSRRITIEPLRLPDPIEAPPPAAEPDREPAPEPAPEPAHDAAPA